MMPNTALSSTHPTATVDPTSLLGKRIDHKTIGLVSILGIGAYGVVYLGRHIYTGRPYAVKLLASNKTTQQEIELHSRLSSHINVLSFDKVVRDGSMTFLVLEYAPEGDLFAAIVHPTHGLAGNNRAIRHIFLQIIDAVQHCHQHGIAHRDLKPENILMFPNWQVKLADFGLATSQLVSAEFGCGSSFYFSPECQGGMIRGHQRIRGYSTQQNDIWSLGVILINFTTGRNPWRRANMQDTTFAAYVRNPHCFFKKILPCISDELDSILSRIFCLDPALRISLPELRLRILHCRSFTREEQQLLTELPRPIRSSPKTTKTMHPALPSMEYTHSTAQAMLHYVGDYTDEIEHATTVSPCPVKPCIASPTAAVGLRGFKIHSSTQPRRSSVQAVPPPAFPPPSSRLPPVPVPAPVTPPTPASYSSSSCSSLSSIDSADYPHSVASTRNKHQDTAVEIAIHHFPLMNFIHS
ncbi:kinase-like domain-containing protein [Radiomyces spectabilis]|uniref:kinase-like domain-containing protein n=1 Tax=Radiomyces spectabilis TaxID=64574 RepID=UPI0022205793|nr:kinase-like domain-containing protein [Radiomyces spectabilis]KAI8379712.1 kinase-like domain-containing protein [Radiomyces spectabilis]